MSRRLQRIFHIQPPHTPNDLTSFVRLHVNVSVSRPFPPFPRFLLSTSFDLLPSPPVLLLSFLPHGPQWGDRVLRHVQRQQDHGHRVLMREISALVKGTPRGRSLLFMR